MPLVNGTHGYGLVTKVLHWLTVLALVGQLVIGLTMDADAAADRADSRADAFEERGEERAEAQGEAAEERFEEEVQRREDAADALGDEAGVRAVRDVLTGGVLREGVTGLEVHVMVGLSVLALGIVRLVWRRTTPLPPWAEHLSPAERTLESWLEKLLLAYLVVVPATGLLLAVRGGDGLLALHVVAQIALGVVVACHVGLVLKHTVVRRHGHLFRMT